jgi:hypothetical protein
MKTKITAALFAISAMLTAACEQHKWSETNQLFKAHGEHGEHGHAHDAAGEHDKAGSHDEKKAGEQSAAPKH